MGCGAHARRKFKEAEIAQARTSRALVQSDESLAG
ncbi:hypothetical protein SG34_033095 [Thalassomonas viridans]|uniref:Transposase n=1 Tax=Thalassomonas viridans TaxID=137584 RepID=A0AAE9Z8J9_9GAMM|nr:hypothetical protein [Thalassomonas viridans]WDE08740.1 hypothetical protein SG34_033095 [Thalassomonas viridans]